MSDLDIPAIRKALAEASEGKWTAVTPRGACAAVRCVRPGGESFYVYLNVNGEMTKETTDRWKADARLIAKMHETLPALLAEIERLRQVEAAARDLSVAHADARTKSDAFMAQRRKDGSPSIAECMEWPAHKEMCAAWDTERAKFAALDAALGGGR